MQKGVLPGPAPRGAFRGRAPQMTACAPQTKIVPPQARNVPRKNQQSRGCWRANRGLILPNWVYRLRICEQELSLVEIFVLKNFFFFGLHLRIREKSQEF